MQVLSVARCGSELLVEVPQQGDVTPTDVLIDGPRRLRILGIEFPDSTAKTMRLLFTGEATAPDVGAEVRIERGEGRRR